MPDLPASGHEVTSLNEIFSDQSMEADLYMENNAHESMIKSKELDQYGYIHFATHGVVDAENPELSKLSFFGSEDENEDGNLYTGEIYNLHLSAKLVTLSACETGLGMISKGEGIIGLSRAFAYAGASNIMVTLWSVYDESTSKLMIDFYRNLGDDDFSAALRNAQLKFIDHPTYSNPYHWAPFILIGQ